MIKWNREFLLKNFKIAHEMFGDDVTIWQFSSVIGTKAVGYASIRKCGFTSWRAIKEFHGIKCAQAVYKKELLWNRKFIKQCLLSMKPKEFRVTLQIFSEETGCDSATIQREWGSWNKLRKNCNLPIYSDPLSETRVKMYTLDSCNDCRFCVKDITKPCCEYKQKRLLEWNHKGRTIIPKWCPLPEAPTDSGKIEKLN